MKDNLSHPARRRFTGRAPNVISFRRISGKEALRLCEEHTTWANGILRNLCREPPAGLIQDLRTSLADGVTLPNLITALTNQRPDGVVSEPVTLTEREENLRCCLTLLSQKGVDTLSLLPADLANGSLSSTLLLISNIKETLSPNPVNSKETPSKEGEPFKNGQSDSSVKEWPNSEGSLSAEGSSGAGMLAGVRPAGVISRRVNGQPSQRFTGGPNYLPGTLRGPDGDAHTTTPSTVHMSSTELDAHGVSQYGGENKWHRLPDHHSAAVKLTQTRPRSASTLHANSPTPSEHPPVALNNAWSTSHKPAQNVGRTAVPQMPGTVEDRLKNLLSNSHSDVSDKTTARNPYEDGELLKPPVPAPRQTTLPADRSDTVPMIEEDNTFLRPVSQLPGPGQRHSVNSTVSSSGYVPSIPSDRWSSSHGDPVFERPSQGRLPSQSSSGQGHENYAFQPDNQQEASSATNLQLRKSAPAGGSDLRAAWNRLYGQEGKPAPKPPPPPYRPSQNIQIRNVLNAPLPQKKGPPPPPPVRHESVLREEGPTVQVTMATTQASAPQSTNQFTTAALRQPVKLEERKTINDQTPVSRPDFLYPDAPGYPQDTQPKLRTVTDDRMNSFNPITSASHTNVHNSHVNRLGAKTQNLAAYRPESSEVNVRSGSYEDLGVTPGEKSQTLRSVSAVSATKPSRDPGFVSRFSSKVRHVNEFPSNYMPSSSDYADIDGLGDTPLTANDSIFDHNDFHSEGSSGSVTPPLPPLSPSNSPPGSPPSSPSPEPKFQRSLSADILSTPKAPDLLTSTKQTAIPDKSRNTHLAHLNWRKYSPRETSAKHRNQKRSKHLYGHMLNGVKDSDEESFPFDIDNTTLTVEQSPRTSVDTARAPSNQIRDLQHKLDGLEEMYAEVLRRVGTERELSVRERRHSIGSSDTSSFRRVGHFGRSSSHKPRVKDFRSINKRFQKLESHVVTLARSVAHLSSEMKSQNALLLEMDRLRQEVKDLREVALSNHKKGQPQVPDFERFRGWVPALTNPKRVNKLTKFFGQEPPLLEIFLKRLGYEKFAQNFKVEHIGMIELPYMTEERLKTIGIPMGPRLRILQEAQLCFRQENFDIYIV